MVHRFDEIAINSTAKKKPEESDRFCYIGLEHIEPGTFEISHWGADAAPVGEKLIMRKGDILFGKRRAYQRKVAIAPFDGIFSAHGMVLRPKEEVICKEYFPFFLSSDQFMDTAIRISVGGLSPTINWKDLQQQEFDLPSPEEQRKLADKLWAAYELKEAYKKMIAATDEMVKAQFIKMFGDPLLFQNDLNLPELKDSVNVISGYPFNASYFNNIKQGMPIIRIRDIQRGFTETYTSEPYDDQYLIRHNDLLIGMDGVFDVARWTSGDAVLNQRVCVLKIKTNEDDVFIQYYIQPVLKHIEKGTNATTVKHISTKQISGIRIPIYDLDKKKHFHNIVEQAEKSKSELRQAIEKIDRVMKSLMQ